MTLPSPLRTSARRLAAPLALPLALALGCATSRPPPAAQGPERAQAVRFPPEEVKVSGIDLDLSGKNDEELFAIGTAAYGAGDHARAAAAFARLADIFPGSRHEAAALFDAGLSYEKLEEWRLALERFRAMEQRYEGPDALEASFKVAECLYHLRELDATRAALDRLAARPGLAAGDRIRALTQRGVVEAEQGRAEEAEKTLRLALSTWEGVGDAERLDPYYPAQAQYYLGEIYREWFRALRLDPSTSSDEKLKTDLEHKSEMLLSAQGHYLRVVRMGDERWAVAAGCRIGELYDELRKQLLDAPLPPGLTEEQAAAYRDMLRSRVRVLAVKAIGAYEGTISRASRSGVEDLQALADAQAALDRLKAALQEDVATGI